MCAVCKMNPWGRCRSSWCASIAFFSLCGYSPPHSSIKQECEIEKNLCVSVVTARGCTCSGSVLSLLACVCTRANKPQQFSGKVGKMQLLSALSH